MADPLPPGNIQGSYRVSASSYANGLLVGEDFRGNISDPVSTTVSATGGAALATGTISLSATTIPAVSAQTVLFSPPSCGFLCGGGGGYARLSGFEFYSFQIFGPTDTVKVHFDAAGHVGIPQISVVGFSEYVSASSSIRVSEAALGTVLADASLGVLGTVQGFQDLANPGVLIDNPFRSVIFSSDFILKTSTIYQVQLHADIEAYADGGGTTKAFADFDPTFTVHGPYSFAFSDGFGGGVAGVPEPAEWALMISGFGLAGAHMRRRRPGRPMIFDAAATESVRAAC